MRKVQVLLAALGALLLASCASSDRLSGLQGPSLFELSKEYGAQCAVPVSRLLDAGFRRSGSQYGDDPFPEHMAATETWWYFNDSNNPRAAVADQCQVTQISTKPRTTRVGGFPGKENKTFCQVTGPACPASTVEWSRRPL